MIKELKSLALSIVDEQDSDFLFEVAKRLETLEKALDKACEMLERGYDYPHTEMDFWEFDVWKEWCLGE